MLAFFTGSITEKLFKQKIDLEHFILIYLYQLYNCNECKKEVFHSITHNPYTRI